MHSRPTGVENSVLKDRVVFVIGAPRSGTTWLNSMLIAHPELVGANESHLFDEGVDRLFDNIEDTDWERQFLRRYLTRDDLVDLVRDLCDGVFLNMRERRNPAARLIVEKTPFAEHPATELRRKLDCYPDARYIHLVRDPRAVARSSSRRWAQPVERTARLWRESVLAVREQLANHPGFQELRYEDLVTEPVPTMHKLFDWLGVRADDEVDALMAVATGRQTERREASPNINATSWKADLRPSALHTIENVAGDVIVELGYELSGRRVPLRARATAEARRRLESADWTRRAATILRPLRNPAARATPDALDKPDDERLAVLLTDVANAFSAGDERALRSLMASGSTVTVRTGAGEQTASADEGIHLLLKTGRELFREPFDSTTWIGSPARLFSVTWFKGVRSNTPPVEFALALALDGYAIRGISVLGYGPA